MKKPLTWKISIPLPHFFLLVLTGWFAFSPFSLPARAQGPLTNLSDYFTVTTANERSVLDRRTMKITSTADVTLTNVSAKAVPAPLHGVITLLGATGPVTMPEALGGPSTAPYNNYYYDLTSKLVGGQLAPGGQVTFTVKFVRSATVTFRYNLIPYGLQPSNLPPLADAGKNQILQLARGQSSTLVILDGSASQDPDGTISRYTWTGTPDPEDTSKPSLTLSPGTYTFSLVVTDND